MSCYHLLIRISSSLISSTNMTSDLVKRFVTADWMTKLETVSSGWMEQPIKDAGYWERVKACPELSCEACSSLKAVRLPTDLVTCCLAALQGSSLHQPTARIQADIFLAFSGHFSSSSGKMDDCISTTDFQEWHLPVINDATKLCDTCLHYPHTFSQAHHLLLNLGEIWNFGPDPA